MAKHEIQIHENTGATKESAPYLGNYVSKLTTDIAAYADDLAKTCGLPAIQVQAILTGAFNEIVKMESESLVRINTDIGQICGVITGSLPTSDAAFDPLKNSLDLVLRPDDEIKAELADVTPTIVTDETVTKVRVDNVVDTEVQRPYNVVYGQREFIVSGMNLVTTDEGAAVYFQNALGTTFPCTVVEVLSKQRVKAKSNAVLPGGDYKLFVKSRGGDAEGPLQASFRKVKYIGATTTITKVVQEGRADDTVLHNATSPCVVHGTGLALGAADKVLIELYKEGVCADEGDLTTAGKVTSSSDTAINLSGFDWNNRTVPDGEWWDAYPDSKLVVVKNGVRYEHPITFKGE